MRCDDAVRELLDQGDEVFAQCHARIESRGALLDPPDGYQPIRPVLLIGSVDPLHRDKRGGSRWDTSFDDDIQGHSGFQQEAA